jgi:putative ABC transport system permease protein
VHRRRLEREMDLEWQFHIDARTDALIAAGVSRDEAERQARVEFGDLLRWKEQGREARGIGWMQDLGSDAQYALRQMRRAPVFSGVVIATLTLGIGANTAIFSLVNSLLLRTLPVMEPERLVTISSETALRHGFTAGIGWNYQMWTRLQQRSREFDGALAWFAMQLNLAQRGERQPIEVLFASGGFFTTLSVPALAGRTFTAEDDVRGGGPDGPVAVISYGFWQRHFGGAANVLGRPLVVEGVPVTIIGVTPPDFLGVEVGRVFDVSLPLGTEPLIRGKQSAVDAERQMFLIVMLRLKAQQSLETATVTLRGMQAHILGTTPRELQRLPPFLREPYTLVPAPTGISGVSRLRQRYERPLLTILVVVALVLLIACANLANLLLARTNARLHELSVRRALGASRWRLVRQGLVESLLLASLGAAAGLAVAAWGSRALVAQLSTFDSVVSLDLSLDWRVLAFTAVLTIATMAFFGTAPAMRAMRVAPIDALKTPPFTVRGSAGPVRRWSIGSSGLVVGQMALSLVLVIAAGLFVRTFERLASVPLGFDRDRVLVVNVNTARAQLDPAARTTFYHRLVAAVATAPGVSHAAGSMWTPVSGGGANLIRNAAGRMVDPSRVVTNFITPGWFAAYGVGLRAGRDIDERDTPKAPPVAVVNEAFVRRFLPGRDAIGEVVDAVGGTDHLKRTRTIVGVAADAVFSGSLRDVVPPMMYVPLAQSVGLGPPDKADINISVRSAAGSPMLVAPSVGAALTAVDRDLAYSFRPLDDYVTTSLMQERIVALLSGFFAFLGLILAAIGLYGVTSYAVSRRRTEIGIRMALGAAPSGVVRLVLLRVSLMVAAGVVTGIAASAWLSRFVAPLLYGLEPWDPMTLSAATLTLVAVGLAAGWLPASAAARVDPAEVLKET